MNELTIYTDSAVTTYNGKTAKLIDIRADNVTYPRIKDIDGGTAIQALANILKVAYMYKGLRADADLIAATAPAIYAELLEGEETRYLALPEIAHAVKLGMKNGVIDFICVISVVRACESYIKDVAHGLMLQIAESRAAEERKKKEESLVDRGGESGLLALYARMRATADQRRRGFEAKNGEKAKNF